ncbi:cytochrome P450 [Wenxinia saemankumensis]|uniref:Cytochrome P450 n=1 Tax=Wenxinia saemankumensis TaxID=1447782 RepID=A0A1M6D4J8_9RHOB|nr:cytochrome P450 [Wenxinia saemankumensis]SHI68041.1 Cytochrome P450 [Wenxinia saemankumensis]
MQRLSQSPTDPAFVQDPYAFYEKARAAGPLFYWEELGMVCATSHRLVSSLLRDRRLGRQVPEAHVRETGPHLDPWKAIERHSLLALEPPDHTRLRKLILHGFTSRRIGGMAASIEALCHDLIDRFPEGEVDLVPAYCRLVPVIVICRLLGVPEDRAEDLLDWSNAMVAMYQARRSRGIEDAAAAASADFSAFLREHIAARRRAPGPDMLSELIAAEEAGDRLSTDELIGLVVLLLNAGHEATVHTLGNGVRAMVAAGRPEVTEAAVEEVIRWDPPLHFFDRWAYEEVEIEGHRLARHDRIGLLLAAANRDPAAYEDPARFDPVRQGPANTSFGAGIHFCVGAPLARLELVIALRVLFERMPGLRIVGTPGYADIWHFHGLERLVVAPD